uniref:Importin-7/11-like TPR repeats domain-containing protein n=1 Tax=Aegilops tauschii subsp. strangulata TaxID=200361 RepID=A0A453AK21_AEGTS
DNATAIQQKEYAMALSVVLTLQIPQVIDKLDDILSVCTTVIIGGREVKTEDDSRCCIVLLYYYDFSLFISIKYLRPLSILCVINYWYNICSGDITSSSWLGNDNSGYSSKFLKKRQAKDLDPIKQASLENILRENLKACAAHHGDSTFNAAISRIHPSSFAQLQQALNSA